MHRPLLSFGGRGLLAGSRTEEITELVELGRVIPALREEGDLLLELLHGEVVSGGFVFDRGVSPVSILRKIQACE